MEDSSVNVVTFPDYARVLDNTTLRTPGASYTATENCWVIGLLESNNQGSVWVSIDGVSVAGLFVASARSNLILAVPLRKGSTISTRDLSATYILTVYGMLQ